MEGKKAAGFVGFGMDDSHVLSCAWEWVMVPENFDDTTTHVTLVSVWFLDSVGAVCFMLNLGHIWI